MSFKVINSPTILLPTWHKTVAGSAFENWALPRDVATRWNSTYDMLSAFIEMKDFVVKFLDSSSVGLVEYALTSAEWDVIEDLVYVMKVCSFKPAGILLYLQPLW